MIRIAVLAFVLALIVPAMAQDNDARTAKITGSSGNVAASTATASIAATPGQMNYICGLSVTGTGATTGVAINPTLTGLNGGTITYTMGIIAGVLLNQPHLTVAFEPCQPATALNTAITLSVPSFGTGNTNATASVWGYRAPF